MKNLLLTLMTTLFFFSGCSVKETTLKPYNYTLEPMLHLKRANVHNNDILKVAYIDAPSSLNTRAILYKKAGATQPYKYGIWSETPPMRLQYLIAEALQDQHHFESVLAGTSMAATNLVLEPVLQNFEEIFVEGGKSYVFVSIRFRLVEVKTGDVLGSIKLSSKKDVTNTNGAAGVVEAFNAASAEVITHLSFWINEVRK